MGMGALYSNIGNLGNIGNSGNTHCLRTTMFFPVTEKIFLISFLSRHAFELCIIALQWIDIDLSIIALEPHTMLDSKQY